MKTEHLLQEKALDAKQLLGATRLESKLSLEMTVTDQGAANRLRVVPPSMLSHRLPPRLSLHPEGGREATDRCLPAGVPPLQAREYLAFFI